MARVVRTASAKADVLAIAEYIARDKPDAAERWIEKVDKTLLQIARFPLMGESVNHLAPELRRHCLGITCCSMSRSKEASSFVAYFTVRAELKIFSRLARKVRSRHGFRRVLMHEPQHVVDLLGRVEADGHCVEQAQVLGVLHAGVALVG